MITITNPRDPVIRAIFIKAHLKAHIIGMKHSQMSGKEVLAHATDITGKPYKRGQYNAALTDIQSIIDKGDAA